eukprot:UC4_evm1s900
MLELKRLRDAKKGVLDDDLAREIYAAETRLLVDQHIERAKALEAWADEKAAYLKFREPLIQNYESNSYMDVQSVSAARLQIGIFEAYEREKDARTAADKQSLHELGEQIMQRKYMTHLSEYHYGAH